jgi:antitoxin component YwqK of YwqJK toxin-antitoxin module
MIDSWTRDWFGLTMKVLPFVLMFSLIIIGCGEPHTSLSDHEKSPNTQAVSESPKVIDLDDNETLNGILSEATDLDSLRTFSASGRLFYFSPNEEKPNTGLLYSGWGKEMYANGKICRLGQFVDGNKEGIWAEWYYDGQQEMQSIIKEGKKNGLHTTWFENGQKRLEANYKAGKKDGLSTEWYENAQKKSGERFTMDKLVSSVVWKPNGEKCPVTKIESGNGVRVDAYYEDGTEVIRSRYKNGSRLEDSSPTP